MTNSQADTLYFTQSALKQYCGAFGSRGRKLCCVKTSGPCVHWNNHSIYVGPPSNKHVSRLHLSYFDLKNRNLVGTVSHEDFRYHEESEPTGLNPLLLLLHKAASKTPNVTESSPRNKGIKLQFTDRFAYTSSCQLELLSQESNCCCSQGSKQDSKRD